MIKNIKTLSKKKKYSADELTVGKFKAKITKG
jgi:hypothetical protein